MIVMARVDWNELSRKAQAKAKANKPSEEVQPLSAKNERTQSTYDLAPARGEEPTPRPSPEAQERERAIKDIIAEGELAPSSFAAAVGHAWLADGCTLDCWRIVARCCDRPSRLSTSSRTTSDPGPFGRRQSCRAGTWPGSSRRRRAPRALPPTPTCSPR